MTMTTSSPQPQLRVSLPGRWTRTELADPSHVSASTGALADLIGDHVGDQLGHNALRDQLERTALNERRDGSALFYFLIAPEASEPWPLLLFVGQSRTELPGGDVATVSAGPYGGVLRTYQERPVEGPLGIPFGRLSYRIPVSADLSFDVVFRFLPVDDPAPLFDHCQRIVGAVDVG
ncbi:hypothetical protein F0U44_05600 [Nocardioides humilatus]|uniref:Uncharacterized protein n=1 Tax=Nocardioides humilatus TaxID=2607660 RepID=A0A5B1LLU8_9ACTN|nr:hypothetical protein [Nocardioides humilatus]KAA1421745.1 hypothetical protein F0U44_05600 [Nocardioides humilatus]